MHRLRSVPKAKPPPPPVPTSRLVLVFLIVSFRFRCTCGQQEENFTLLFFGKTHGFLTLALPIVPYIPSLRSPSPPTITPQREDSFH